MSPAAAPSGDLTRLDASALAAQLASGDVSSVEATQAHLDRIAAVDGDIHAFLHLNADALDTAAAIRSRCAWVASTLDTSPAASRAASSDASSRVMSSEAGAALTAPPPGSTRP